MNTWANPSGRALVFDTFWSKVNVAGDNDCWIWQKSLRGGYGVYRNGSKNVAAHRHAVLLSGRDIPDKMVVDHICRTRSCVNPKHLRVVTRYQNVHENSQAIAHMKSLQTHCVHGHELDGINLILKRGRRYCRMCSNTYQRELRKQRAAHKKLAPSGFDHFRMENNDGNQ